jgi:hypothetical protein
MKHLPIVVGDRFGRLTVISPGTPRGSHRRWICACDCGSSPKEIEQSNLRSGASASCGCQVLGTQLMDSATLTHIKAGVR